MESGEVTSVVGEQVVVKSTGKPPEIGSKAYTKKDFLGVVADVIGPVDKPYFIVKKSGKNTAETGEKIYSK